MKMRVFSLALVVLCLTAAPLWASEALIAEWLFTDGSGAVVQASPQSMYVSDAVLQPSSAGADWQSDAQGTFFNFSGDDFFVASFDSFPLDLAASFRVTFDFKAGGNCGFISNSETVWSYGAFVINKGNGKLNIQQHSAGGGYGNLFVGDADWHSFEGTFDSDTGTIQMFIDSVEDTNVQHLFGFSSFFNQGSRPNVVIGAQGVDAGNPFNALIGSIKNIRLYQDPNMPHTPSPYNGETGVLDGAQTLTWAAPYDPYSKNYDVYFSDNQALVQARDVSVKNTVATNSLPVTVDGGKTYYWLVDSYRADDSPITPMDWSFQTVASAPYALTPNHDTDNVSIYPTLSWSQDLTADSFNVYIAMSEAGLATASPMNVAGTSIDLTSTPLDLNEDYFWQVGAVIGVDEYLSAVAAFSTADDEMIDPFDYTDNAVIQATWVQQPGSAHNISTSDRRAQNPGEILGIIPHGPHSGDDGSSTFIRTFDTAIDMSTADILVIDAYHEANTLGGSVGLTLTLLDATDQVLAEGIYVPGVDGLLPDTGFAVQTWIPFAMSLRDEFGGSLPGMDAVKKIQITVPGTTSAKWLFINDLRLSIPLCAGNLIGDANGDCLVDLEDFAAMNAAWMDCERFPASSCFDYFFEVFED